MVHLVHLDVDIDVSDKLEWSEEADRSQHQEEHVTGQDRVTEELDGLQQAWHVRPFEVVKQRIEKHEQSRWSENKQKKAMSAG